MEIINLLKVILKFILLVYMFNSLFESIKARENGNFIREFRYLLLSLLILISLKN